LIGAPRRSIAAGYPGPARGRWSISTPGNDVGSDDAERRANDEGQRGSAADASTELAHGSRSLLKPCSRIRYDAIVPRSPVARPAGPAWHPASSSLRGSTSLEPGPRRS